MSKKLFPVLPAVLLCLLLVGAVLAQGTATVDWGVISNGGGPAQGDGRLVLNATLGQPIAGYSSNLSLSVGSGYWYGIEGHYRLHLPVVTRNG